MEFVKDKSSIKYFILAVVCVVSIYLGKLADLFEPIYKRVYYGNLKVLFNSLIAFFIWILCIVAIGVVSKKVFKINAFKEENSGGELPLKRVGILALVVLIPMFSISAYIHWKIKLVYSLGMNITSTDLACNAGYIISQLARIVLMVMAIKNFQQGMEMIIKSKFQYIPWGALFLTLTVGLIDLIFFPIEFKWFYFICSFLYGVIYLLSNKSFYKTALLSYLIFLL